MSGQLESVERLCTEVHGRGAAVSVNKEAGRWVVRCWNAKGIQVEQAERLTQPHALGAMLLALRRRAADTIIGQYEYEEEA